MVFQIVDDLLDLTATESQLGKPAGHDLEEGVYTLPVLRTLAAAGVAVADELRDLLGSRCRRPSATRRWPSCGSATASPQAYEVGRAYADAAVGLCRHLPDNAATDALRAAPLRVARHGRALDRLVR